MSLETQELQVGDFSRSSSNHFLKPTKSTFLVKTLVGKQDRVVEKSRFDGDRVAGQLG